jgi:aminoglycoside phosphotransferase (APT) family kinase protein
VADDMTIAAVLDFEMASIGPAELDLAWFLVLHRMTVERAEAISRVPRSGATVERLRGAAGSGPWPICEWFEVFAALRSGAIMVRAARLLARASGSTTAGSPGGTRP